MDAWVALRPIGRGGRISQSLLPGVRRPPFLTSNNGLNGRGEEERERAEPPPPPLAIDLISTRHDRRPPPPPLLSGSD